jgi:hypothetical protein
VVETEVFELHIAVMLQHKGREWREKWSYTWIACVCVCVCDVQRPQTESHSSSLGMAACKNTAHYFQLLMAVVLKIMVTWTKLSHSEDGDIVSLKWQLFCVKTRRLQSSKQPANIKHYL